MLNFTNATLCLPTSPCVSLEESFAETTTEFKNRIIVFTNTVTNVHQLYDSNLFSSHSAHLSRRRTATILHNTRACYEARSFFTLLVIFSTVMLTRARVHRTTVEALQGPDTLNCLLVTPPPWDRLRALGQGCPLIKIPKTFLQTTVIQHNRKVRRGSNQANVQVALNVRVPRPQPSTANRAHLSSRPKQLQVVFPSIVYKGGVSIVQYFLNNPSSPRSFPRRDSFNTTTYPYPPQVL